MEGVKGRAMMDIEKDPESNGKSNLGHIASEIKHTFLKNMRIFILTQGQGVRSGLSITKKRGGFFPKGVHYSRI